MGKQGSPASPRHTNAEKKPGIVRDPTTGRFVSGQAPKNRTATKRVAQQTGESENKE